MGDKTQTITFVLDDGPLWYDSQYKPDLVEEKNHPFSECATFADNIKGEGYSFQAGWHFINLPYLDEPGTSLDDFSFT